MVLPLTDSPIGLRAEPAVHADVERALALLGLEYRLGERPQAGGAKGGAPEQRVTVARGPLPPLPPHAALLSRQGRVAVYLAGQATLLRSGGAAAGVTADTVRLVLEPRTRTSDAAAVLAMSLFVLLGRRGFVPLHAAALDYGGAGVLLVGPSDAGKSTLAYLLVQAGWRYLSDDSVLLHRTGTGEVEAWTFRRRFGLDPEAGALFPELVPHARPVAAAAGAARLADGGKWSVAVDGARPGHHTPCTRPRLLVFPRLEPARPSATGAAGRAEAFIRVRAQMALRGLSAAWTRAHEALVGALAQQATAVHLRAGRDLLAHAARADALLRPLLPSPPPSAPP